MELKQPLLFPATRPARSPSPAPETLLSPPTSSSHSEGLVHSRPLAATGTVVCAPSASVPSTFIAHEKYYWFSRAMEHVKRARRHRVEWCAIYTAHLSLQLQGWLAHRHTEKGQTLDCWDSYFWNVIKHRPRWKGPPGSLACNKDVPFDEPALMNRNF